ACGAATAPGVLRTSAAPAAMAVAAASFLLTDGIPISRFRGKGPPRRRPPRRPLAPRFMRQNPMRNARYVKVPSAECGQWRERARMLPRLAYAVSTQDGRN